MGDDLEHRLGQLESRVDSLGNIAVDNDGEIEDLQHELREARDTHNDRIAELEHEVRQLTQSIGFIKQAAAAEASSTEAKAALALQTLVNKARSNGGSSELDWQGIQTALNGEIDRTRTYDVMRRMDSAADVVTFVKEGKNAARNTRVELRMDEGETYHTQLGGQTVAVTMEEV